MLAGPVAADDRFGSYRASVHYLAGERVRQLTATSPRLWIAILLAVALAGCATRPAPDFGGRWKPVNRYSEAPNEIPLHQSYVFYPSPMDGTLKAMLTRWAQDSNMKLDYQHYSDFTLHQAVSQIHTTSLPDAISQLNSAYAGHGVVIAREGEQIVVRSAVSAAPAAGNDTPAVDAAANSAHAPKSEPSQPHSPSASATDPAALPSATLAQANGPSR